MNLRRRSTTKDEIAVMTECTYISAVLELGSFLFTFEPSFREPFSRSRTLFAGQICYTVYISSFLVLVIGYQLPHEARTAEAPCRYDGSEPSRALLRTKQPMTRPSPFLAWAVSATKFGPRPKFIFANRLLLHPLLPRSCTLLK